MEKFILTVHGIPQAERVLANGGKGVLVFDTEDDAAEYGRTVLAGKTVEVVPVEIDGWPEPVPTEELRSNADGS